MNAAKEKLIAWYDAEANTRTYWRTRHHFYHREIERLVKFLIPADVTLAEVGCGTGDLLAAIPATKKVGIDFSEAMRERGHILHPDLTFVTGDIETYSASQRFDYVLLSELVGSLFDIGIALKNVQAMTADRGRVVIIYHNFLWQPLFVVAESLGLKAQAPVQNWITPSDLENFLMLANCEVVKSGSRLLIPWRIPLVSWLANRVLARLPIISRLCMLRYVVARPVPRARENLSVSIVVPARNEEGNIARIAEGLAAFSACTEIIFVEGHSKDRTWDVIKAVAASGASGTQKIIAVQQDGVGKGDAVRKGFSLASGDVLMIFDADGTVPAEDLPKFYDAIASGKGDFINGSRLVYPMEKQAMRFLNVLGNKFFAGAFSWLLSQRVKDTLCGTKVLRRLDYERIAAGRAYFGDFDPFGDYDLLFGAAKLNLKIVELPVRYRERTYGATNISRFRHGWLLLKMCVFAAGTLKFNR